MAITYKYTKAGFNTTISVFKDSNQIYSNSSSTAGKDLLLREAKVSLQDKYPDVMTMQEEATSQQVANASTEKNASQNNKQNNNSSSQNQTGSPTPTPAPLTQIPKEKSTASGLNRVTTSFSKSLIKAQNAINNFYYGKPESVDAKTKKLKNPLNYGLKPLLDTLSSVDICNIVNYAINKSSKSKPFNPKDTSKTNTPLGKIKYDIQYFAYEVQSYIDDFYATNGDINSVVSTIALQVLHTKLSEKTSKIIDSGILTDPVLISAFPQLSLLGNFFSNSMGVYAKYNNIQSLPIKEVQKFIKFLDKLKTAAIAIQSLNNPANLLAVADSFIGGEIAQQIQKINKIIDPKKIQNVLKKLLDTCKKIVSVIKTVLRIVNFLKVITRILVLVLTILRNIRLILFFGLPIPNIFTTAGITTVVASGSQELKTGIDKLLDRVIEVNNILQTIYNIFTDLIVKLYGIIDGLKMILLNLQNCDDLSSTKDGETIESPTKKLADELSDTIKDLEDVNNQMIKYVQTYDNNKKKKTNSFGEYEIKILKEELVDEGISLKRRYGVAMDKNQIVVVKSTPTFASDDNVIIQEVKMLLVSKNLVKQKSMLSIQELEVLQEASNFLDSEEVDFNLSLEALDNFESDNSLDDPESEDEDTEDNLGLNAFVNGIKKGGRKLRRRMRREMIKMRKKLNDANAKSDPSGKYTGKFKSQNTEKVRQLKIEDTKDKIKQKKEQIAHMLLNFAIPPPIRIIKLRTLYKELKDLEKTLAELNKTRPPDTKQTMPASRSVIYKPRRRSS